MHNAGVPGLTSSQLLSKLTDDDAPEHELARSADIDIITIGANDVSDDHDPVTHGDCPGTGDRDCVADELSELRANLTGILSTIQHERAGRSTTILVTGYWNVFEDGDVARTRFPRAGVAASQRLTAALNAVIESVSDQMGTHYVDLVGPFNGGDPTSLLAPDGDHPNSAGHRLIAQTLLAAGLPGLR